MHTISLSYCRTSFILVVACIACGIVPLSEIFIRASAHSWLGFIFAFPPSADPVTDQPQGAPAQRGNWRPRHRGGRGRRGRGGR